MLSFNHYYLLNFLKPGMKVLDYGCGAGEMVSEGRKRGHDICGADVFYGGANDKERVEKLGTFNDTIFEIKNGKLDFDNETFDTVLSNQVFEHVEDLDAVLSEIRRVLKKGGILISLFPSKCVAREGHIGIPFSHWFPKKSKIRFVYTLICRTLGLGFFKGGKSNVQWTKDALDWLDKYTIYRRKNIILRIFEKYFSISFVEDHYVLERMQENGKLKYLSVFFKVPFVPELAKKLFRFSGGMVMIAKKNNYSR